MTSLIEQGQTRFPLLNANCVIAGWTGRAPHFEGSVLRHHEAEKVVGGAVVIVPVLLLVDAHIRMAGGEPNPDGLWVLSIAHMNCVRRMPIAIRGE